MYNDVSQLCLLITSNKRITVIYEMSRSWPRLV